MTTGNADEKSVMNDVFSNGSDMGADFAAPGAQDVTAEAPATPLAETMPEQIAKADEVKDDEAPPQGRDPATGRFVPVTELVAERKKLKGERDAEAKLRTEAEARAKAYQDQVEQLQRSFMQTQQQTRQPQQEPQRQPIPDPILDPEGFANYQAQVFDARIRDVQINMSERYARIRYGDQAVNEALQAAHQARIAHRFQEAQEPFEALLAWHRRTKQEAEIGGDLEAFKKRIAEAAVQKALAGLKAGNPAASQAQVPTQRFPSTLADQTAQGNQGTVLTEAEIMDQAFAKKRA